MADTIALVWLLTGGGAVVSYLKGASIGNAYTNASWYFRAFFTAASASCLVASVLWHLNHIEVVSIPIHVFFSGLFAVSWWPILYRAFHQIRSHA